MITKLCLRTAFTAVAYMTTFETTNLEYQQKLSGKLEHGWLLYRM